jgi:hypothetical protein
MVSTKPLDSRLQRRSNSQEQSARGVFRRDLPGLATSLEATGQMRDCRRLRAVTVTAEATMEAASRQYPRVGVKPGRGRVVGPRENLFSRRRGTGRPMADLG